MKSTTLGKWKSKENSFRLILEKTDIRDPLIDDVMRSFRFEYRMSDVGYSFTTLAECNDVAQALFRRAMLNNGYTCRSVTAGTDVLTQALEIVKIRNETAIRKLATDLVQGWGSWFTDLNLEIAVTSLDDMDHPLDRTFAIGVQSPFVWAAEYSNRSGVMTNLIGDTLYLMDIHLPLKWRGQGIGQALYRMTEELGWLCGAKKVNQTPSGRTLGSNRDRLKYLADRGWILESDGTMSKETPKAAMPAAVSV